MLAITIRDHPFDWEYHIQKVCMAYNTSIRSTTWALPFMPQTNQRRLPMESFAITLKTTLGKACDPVRDKTNM